MNRPELLLLFAAMALVTFLERGAFIIAGDRVRLPPLVRRALTYVPPAVFAAITVPALLRSSGVEVVGFDVRLLAGAVAAVVAWRTRHVLATSAAGMLALWGLTWLAR
jgi:branched-subunit amino acid transport protein